MGVVAVARVFGVAALVLAVAASASAHIRHRHHRHHHHHHHLRPLADRSSPLGSRLGAHSMLYLNTPYSFERTMFQDAARLGVSEMRMDLELSGVFTDPSNPTTPWWNWVDQYVALAKQYNMPILANLTAQPAFDSSCAPDYHCAPANLSVYYQQVYKIVRYTRGVINDFEIWNEPDGSWSFRGTPQQYGQMESVAYAAIHAANPNARVVMGGLMTPQNPAWLAQAVAAGMKWDITNIHLRLAVDKLAGWVRYYERFGKPVWVTEMGYPADRAYQWEPGYQNRAASQAAYDRAAILSMLGAGAAKVFVTERDMPPGNRGFSSEGVIGRPAFSMVHLLATAGY